MLISASFFKKLFPVLIFFILSLIVILIWFKDGQYYGGAEVGLSPFYNPARYLNIQQFIWWSDVAPGTLVPQFINAVPLYFALSILQTVFSPLIIQAIIFFCLLFLMGYGMYKFYLSFVEDNKYYSVIAALFYMFNSYMMVEVWHRFLYTGFFLAASLPILALLWKKWINEGNFSYLVSFLLTNLLFSYMYGNLTSFITLWIVYLFFTLAEAFFPWKGKNTFLKLIFRFFFGLSLFLLTNLWWLLPVFKVSTTVLPEQHSFEDNLSTLVNISKQTITPYLLQYANPFYLFYNGELGNIYSSFIFKVLPWLPAAVILVGLFKSLKNKILAPIGFSYLLALIIAKGAAPPFGYPYIWGLMNIFIVGVIRNPFEKLGIPIPFFGSMLFVAGLKVLNSDRIKKPWDFISKSIVFITLISIVIYAFPMFTGRVFNKPDNSLKINVPQYYSLADNWLKNQKNSSGNILHLPFSNRDTVTYNWDYGYHGVEINEILFTALPSFTRNIGFKRADDTLQSLSFIFTPPFSSDKKQILKLLQYFNVQYIVLHKEVNWDDISTYGKSVNINNPQIVEETLNSLDFLEKSVSFGDLIIYKMKDNFYQSKITFADSIDTVYPGESNILQTLSFSNNDQITTINKFDEVALKNSSKLILFPENILYTWEPSNTTLEAIMNQVIANTNDNSLPTNRMITIKERFFSQTGELLSETLADKIISASDSLINLAKKGLNNNYSSSQSILDDYSNLIDSIFSKGFKGSSIQREFNQDIAKVFTLHLYILERFYQGEDTKEKQSAKKIQDKLNNYLVENNVLPKYFLVGQGVEDMQRRVHSFQIPKRATYKLSISDANTLSLYSDSLSKINFQLDGKEINPNMELDLDQGLHEISYNVPPSSNLLAPINKFSLEGAAQLIDNQLIQLTATPQTGSAATSTISNVAGGDTYQINFEANFGNAKEFYSEILEDIQSIDNKDNCAKTTCLPVQPDPSISGWQKFSILTNPLNLASRKADLRILLPLNNNSSSIVQIRNLSINRIMNNNLILTADLSEGQKFATSSAQLTELKKISAVEYQGRIKLERPAFMFFKETFNPDWTLELSKNGNTYKIDKHYLGNLYGNTYFIDKAGEYDFKIEFQPQKIVDEGVIASAITWFGIVLTLIYSQARRKHVS